MMLRGTQGAMRLHRSGSAIYPEIPNDSESFAPQNPTVEVKSTHDGTLDHMKNFLNCMRSRATPNASVEVGVAAARAGDAANLALCGSGVWNAT